MERIPLPIHGDFSWTLVEKGLHILAAYNDDLVKIRVGTEEDRDTAIDCGFLLEPIELDVTLKFGWELVGREHTVYSEGG